MIPLNDACAASKWDSSRQADSASPISGEMTRVCLRLRNERREGQNLVVGWGSAFGVDISEYGFAQPRYLLSACHCVREEDGSLSPVLKIEVCRDGFSRWTSCKVVAFDARMDVCLLEAETDLPHLATLGDGDPARGNSIVLVGCKAGVVPTPYRGAIVDAEYGYELCRMAVPFYHGDSGGPVFDEASGQVLGVAIAGIGNGSGEMVPNVGLFRPMSSVSRFLRTAARRQGLSPDSPARKARPDSDREPAMPKDSPKRWITIEPVASSAIPNMDTSSAQKARPAALAFLDAEPALRAGDRPVTSAGSQPNSTLVTTQSKVQIEFRDPVASPNPADGRLRRESPAASRQAGQAALRNPDSLARRPAAKSGVPANPLLAATLKKTEKPQ